MIYFKRQWKIFKIQSDWDLFKRLSNDCFNAVWEAKNKSWTNFLNNAKSKKVFQAYKYTKSRNVENLLSISHNDEIKIDFEEKCDALIEAIFSLSLKNVQKRLSKDFLSQRLLFDVINNFEDKQHRRKWEKVIHRKIKNAIFSSSLKKASNSNLISFFILQISYYAISDLFDIVLSGLIKNKYYSQCWKKSIKPILKKSNKVDYSQFELYRIIMLLNCLSKIFEKIIAIRWSHFVEHSNLLYNK